MIDPNNNNQLIVIPSEPAEAEPVSLGLVIGIAIGFILILGGSIGLYLCHIKNVKKKKLMAKMKKNKQHNPDEAAAQQSDYNKQVDDAD